MNPLIAKSRLNQMSEQYSYLKLEKALVKLFIDRKSLRKPETNSYLKSAYSTAEEAIVQQLDKLIESRDLSIYDLVETFELMIPKGDKKLNGAFYTPFNIVNLMTDAVDINAKYKYIDPSCGCGAFLLVLAEKIHKKTGNSYTKIFETNIYGNDIAEYGVRRAKILFSLKALENKEDNDIKFNIKCSDTLTTDLKKSFEIGAGFDVVIGNPPYVKFQDLPNEKRSVTFKQWRTIGGGNYNLYFPFFEIGVELLNDEGCLVYITPNNFFTSFAGYKLRSYLIDNKLLDMILDFNHTKVFSVQTYTAITTLNKKSKSGLQFKRLSTKNQVDNARYGLIKKNMSKIDYSNLDNTKWRLLEEKDQNNIRVIESTGIALGDLFNIRVGIATLADKLYFVDDIEKSNVLKKYYNGEWYEIEKGITKKIRKISDYRQVDDIELDKRRIIFPYKRKNGKVTKYTPEELSRNFPKTHNYLQVIRRELGLRNKGNVDVEYWYEYARSQALNLFGKKLLTPTFSKYPRFLLDEDPDSLFCNGYALYEKNEKNLSLLTDANLELAVLQKILNSRVMDYYAKLTSYSIDGGYACYQKNYIEKFGIPHFSKNEIEKINSNSQEWVDEFLIKKYALDLI